MKPRPIKLGGVPPGVASPPMDAPNAYATGRSPFAAMVGVTRGIKAMTLEPEIIRDGVVRLSGTVDNEQERREAEQLARNTEGVREVRNRLEVQEGEQD